MNPVMYLIANPSVPMSKGKFAAQAGHAVMASLEASPDNWLRHVWRFRGGHYAKVVLMADDLMVARDYIQDRGFKCGMIIDEGRTEFGNTLTPTFLWVQIVDKDDANVKATFSQFKLYKDEPVVVIECTDRMSPETLDALRKAAKAGATQKELRAIVNPEPAPKAGFFRSRKRKDRHADSARRGSRTP